ncbi:DinB family protein [Lutibacter sp. Hel_I_33_5]|uniref:DinB family protein n=1 Tax=Lutibacter sp. Hel_I_33_5 TaxID=1566289 RepID=UPI00119F77B4|nr:DinB family protein [Lutibacter sp. Hel_I_33_5]TVZ55890.1 DinB family protein [Lutibacter sp. Hel_I_33_5]
MHNRLEQLVEKGIQYISTCSDVEISKKPSPEKWSKKEILGHLIDSGINNLQRFTEIQFENKPYAIRNYSQDGLIKANDYQNSEIKEIVAFWVSINNRIKQIMIQQTEKTLSYKIILPDETNSDLRFLMTDYIDHLEHHLNQIIDK